MYQSIENFSRKTMEKMSTTKLDNWILDNSEILEFASLLDDIGAFMDTSSVIYFFEKPWKWNKERDNWIELGRPDSKKIIDDDLVEKILDPNPKCD